MHCAAIAARRAKGFPPTWTPLIEKSSKSCSRTRPRLSLQIGKKVGLSVTPCWKRIRKLERAGVIAKRVAILVPGKVGLGLTVYVNIQIDDHSPEGVEAFAKSVCAMPEVLECQRVAGAVDFFLRVVAVDVPHYEAFYRRLTGLMPLRGVSAYIAVQQLKFETALPLYLIPESSARGEREEDGVNS